MVAIGETVRVKVLDIDRDRQRISLGLKQTQEDPWQRVLNDTPPGDVLEGKVTKVVAFGAFVEIVPGVEGLVHISELAEHHVENPSEVVEPGLEAQGQDPRDRRGAPPPLAHHQARRGAEHAAPRPRRPGRRPPQAEPASETSERTHQSPRLRRGGRPDVSEQLSRAAEEAPADAEAEAEAGRPRRAAELRRRAHAEAAEAAEAPERRRRGARRAERRAPDAAGGPEASTEADRPDARRGRSTRRRARASPHERRTPPTATRQPARAAEAAPVPRPLTIGLTGGDRRRQVRRRLQPSSDSAPQTISTDAVVHELLASEPVRGRLVERWGAEVARRRRGRSRPGRRDRLRRARASWPGSRRSSIRWSASGSARGWPRLPEGTRVRRRRGAAAVRGAGWTGAFDATVAIVTADAVRRERAEARGHSARRASARRASCTRTRRPPAPTT